MKAEYVIEQVEIAVPSGMNRAVVMRQLATAALEHQCVAFCEFNGTVLEASFDRILATIIERA